MSTSVLVVVGSGPGIGVHTAVEFASKGFQSIALISRDSKRLEADKETVQKAGSHTQVKTYAADVGDHAALQKALQQTETDLGAPDVVLFNAARIVPTTIGETSAEDVLGDLKTMSLGLYVTASWAKPHLEARASKQDARPCFFLSGSGVGDVPMNFLFSLCMQKAAQQNLIASLRQVLGPKGVHVAYASIDGQVSDEEPELNAKHIAATYWELYQEQPNQWRDVVVIGELSKSNPYAKK